jgi:hypothetical protein
MKIIKKVLFLVLVIIMVSCNKKDEPEIKPIETIEILTSQSSYKAIDKIPYSIRNETSKEIMYLACQYESDPNVAILKKNQNTWDVASHPPCPEFSWISMNINEIRKDTIIENLLEIGIYKLQVHFVNNNKDTLIYSNLFEIIE